MKQADGMKLCGSCGPERGAQPISAFGKDRSRPDGLGHMCKECARTRSKNFRRTHPKKVNAFNSAWRKKRNATRAWYDHLWHYLQHRGALQVLKERGVTRRRRAKELAVDVNYLKFLFERQEGRCYLTGIPFELKNRNSSRFPSLDRIDSKKGYTPDNVALCCRWVNYAKNQWSVEEMLENFALAASKFVETNASRVA